MIRAAIGGTLSILVVASFAGADPTERYSPFLDDLQARIEAYSANIGAPGSRLQERQQRALGLAHGALGVTATTLREELEVQADAVTALWPVFRKDPVMDSAVDQAMNLFLRRMWARAEQLADRNSQDPFAPGAAESRRRAIRFRSRYSEGTLSSRNWKAAAKRLVKAAAELEAIADIKGASRDCSFVQGTITATVGETAVQWRIASASNDGSRGEFILDGFGLDPDHFTSVDWSFTTRGLMNPGSGAVYPQSGTLPFGPPYTDRGDIYLSRGILFPTIFERDRTVEYYPDRTDEANELVITAWDPAAGTASGTFRFLMDPTDGGPEVLATGQFTVTGGLESW